MEWYHVAVIVIAVLAIDRLWLWRSCNLRHNPLDTAIEDIKKDIREIREILTDKL